MGREIQLFGCLRSSIRWVLHVWGVGVKNGYESHGFWGPKRRVSGTQTEVLHVPGEGTQVGRFSPGTTVSRVGIWVLHRFRGEKRPPTPISNL